MKILTFTQAHTPALASELAAQVATLAPITGADGRSEAVFQMVSDGDLITLYVPDGADATAIGKVVSATAPPDPAADALAAIRVQRDRKLAACDWTQLPDSGGRLPLKTNGTRSTAAEWATYRQQLAGYPDQAGFDPLNPPAWPTPPAEI